ncbi:MAG: amino acid adenylation domain-containing protein [Desulfovibrionaceae bacterium]|nr:amino acid adenylation domain-containing protein [Desulfovibrionaceae bacterium]
MYMTHIMQKFESVARACPDRTAVYDNGRSLTFQQLYDCVVAEAVRLGARLHGKTGQIIAVLLPKSLEAVIAQLAVLYSGNTYMNVDVRHPEKRIRAILEQVRPALVIAGKDSPACAENVHIFEPEPASRQAWTPEERAALLLRREQCIDTDLLCIINTSGSTGIPKAVALTHRSFIDYVESVSAAGLVDDGETVGSLAPVVFDHYSFELCLLAVKGCALILIPESYAAFPIRMLELLARQKVTFLFWVPTIMVNIANMDLLRQITLPTLKKVWFAGEVFPTAKFNYWRRHLPDVLFVNLYGPTEITVDCVYHVIQRNLRDDEPIPIGRPLKNTSILVLDDKNRLVTEPGTEGELCVRGSSLALGYYNNPEKTSAAFVQNPLNTAYPEIIYRTGDIVFWNEYEELVFKGRKDTLIKHSGYRIELGEIEHVVVNTLKLMPNCCALYDAERKRIVLIGESASPLPEKELRQKLGAVLPRYMVPSVYTFIPEMPLNSSGKIDRQLLKNLLKNTQEPCTPPHTR